MCARSQNEVCMFFRLTAWSIYCSVFKDTIWERCKKSESFGTVHFVIDRSLLLHLWLKKLKFFYLSYKYKHIKLQLFVFKLCFCWSSILCLETRLHELQNKWSPNSSDSFFHSWLSFGSRSIIWGYSCCQKFSLPPVSVPWAAEPVEGYVWGLFGAEAGWDFSGILASQYDFMKDQILALRHGGKVHTGCMSGRLNWTW